MSLAIQWLKFNSKAAENARSKADASRYGVHGQHTCAEELKRLNIDQLDPIDPRFTLESIAEQVKDIAYQGLGY